MIRIEYVSSAKLTSLSLSSGRRTCVPAASLIGLSEALCGCFVHQIYNNCSSYLILIKTCIEKTNLINALKLLQK